MLAEQVLVVLTIRKLELQQVHACPSVLLGVMTMFATLNLLAHPFLRQPLQTRLVRWSPRMLVDDCGVNAQRVFDLESGQVAL